LSPTSWIAPFTPEERDVIRAATSLLCKELQTAPAHLVRSDVQKEWVEIEVRLRSLIRLERDLGKSAGAGSSQIVMDGDGSIELSSTGEEREGVLFCDALRDG
ncbi:hypothetical protein BDR03DRAFT_820134, partial [Suillus americanus]